MRRNEHGAFANLKQRSKPMNGQSKLVIAGITGAFVAILGVFLAIGVFYWIDSTRAQDDQGNPSGQRQASQQQQQAINGFQSKQIGWIFTRLDTLEEAQSLTNDDALQSSIEAEVDKAIAAAGVDKHSLANRIHAIIREIAKQSATKQGRAEQRPPQPSAGRQDAAGIGQPVSGVSPVSADSDHILGDPDAPVSLIAYDDFECPFCKRHHPTLKTIAKRFEGQVNVVFRHLPLGMHNPVAKDEALLSECVARQGDNDAFWQFADGVFKRTGGNGRGLTETQMSSLLGSLDLDAQSVRDCVADNRDELLAGINANVNEAQRLGVRGTPGNVLIHNASGEALRINGARPMRQFAPAITAFLGDQ